MLTSNKLKKILIIAIFLILAIYINSIAVVSPTKNFYVNDYAEVLNTETEEYIMSANIELEQKTGAQIVVVTLKSLDGYSIEEYATELFRKFGIGDKNKNNGILLLCSTGDRMFRIEVGYGLEGRLTDGKTGRIQDEYIIPYLKNNNYNEGIKNGFNAVLQEVLTEYEVTIGGIKEAINLKDTNTDNSFNVIMLTTIPTIILGIIHLITKKDILFKIKIYYVFIVNNIVVYLINKELVLLSFIINIVMLAMLGPMGKASHRGRRFL